MAIEQASSRSATPAAGSLVAFVVLTLSISWAVPLLTVRETVPPLTPAVLMLTPAVVVIVLRRVEGDSVVGTVVTSLRGSTRSSLAFAVGYPLVFLAVVAAVALGSGLAVYRPGAPAPIVGDLATVGPVTLAVVLLLNLALTYGEELGWRGYLLPALTERWGPVSAAAAVGVVWGLFHSAFLYRAAVVTGVGDPLLVTVVQALAVFTVSFPFAYCYFLSRGSVFQVVVFHLVWNLLNPWLLGDIYGNLPGVVAGEVLVVTGEGVLGVVVGGVMVAAFVALFRRRIGLRTTLT